MLTNLCRSAPKCYDCFDFVALAVKHAVTVLLNIDETIDDDLRIFERFEDCVCDLVRKASDNEFI